MFLKVAQQWHSWQLIWIKMVQSTHYRQKMHILMAAILDVQAIKLWHCLYITQPCVIYLGLQQWKLKVSRQRKCLFWELFNEILTEIKGKNYKFNPKSIMVDENGANYCTIRKVFGLEFATSKVVSCQMHYKNDVNRASLKIGDIYKDVFKNICWEMCSITTIAEYNDRKK